MPGNPLYRRPQAFGLHNSSRGHAIRQKRAGRAAHSSSLSSPAKSSSSPFPIARTNPSFETRMTLDLEYMKCWSLLLDFKLLVQTIQLVLAGEGQ
jgi:lipopolysaccharide/colanic/teichoic acid biosynthesis glycosyltransferase